jgi:hypothetical protein
MSKFNLSTRDGYLIADISNNRYIIDTGIPFSIGTGILSLGHRTYRLNTPPMKGFAPSRISDVIGLKIDGLIGLDILLDGGCEINLPANEIIFFQSGSKEHVDRASPGGKYLFLTAQIGDRPHRLIFDTGAPVGYLLSLNSIKNSKSLEQKTSDFIGYFDSMHETNLWQVDMQIDRRNFSLRFGLPPEGLPNILNQLSADGVFGSEICKGNVINLGPGAIAPSIRAA